MTAPTAPAGAARPAAGRIPALHRAFRAVLVALAYPGRAVPVAPTARQALELVLLSTWDAGCRIATAGSPVTLPWPVTPVPAAGAELLLVGGPTSGGAVAHLPLGDEACPEAGATAVFCVDRAVSARRVRLLGPGVREQVDVDLPLDAADLEARERACATWPLGVDILVVDVDGTVLGLPRTTRLERRD